MSVSDNIIIGAGPAGLGCAYILGQISDRSIKVIEKENSSGGLCRTIDHNGYLFDIGGHRFLTDSDRVKELWGTLMNGQMLSVNRRSRIFFENEYFDYPMSVFDVIGKISPLKGLSYINSYFQAKLNKKDIVSFEDWANNKFGKGLYETFFKPYTEKVWGLPCTEISAELGEERIGGVSLNKAILNAVFGSRDKKDRNMYDTFLYPQKGPGDMFRRLEEKARNPRCSFSYDREIGRIDHDDHRVFSVQVRDVLSGASETIEADNVFSSMPLTDLVLRLYPEPNDLVLGAARRLRFRNFISVNVILDKKDIFPDQWIYVHSPDIKLSRIQNYKNWSKSMVPDENTTSLGLEYFCSDGDDIWIMPDEELIKYALDELHSVGIMSEKIFIDGFVVRRSKAYPIYSLNYRDDLDIVLGFINKFSNLKLIGRQGTFQYCNSDQALLSGIIVAEKM